MGQATFTQSRAHDCFYWSVLLLRIAYNSSLQVPILSGRGDSVSRVHEDVPLFKVTISRKIPKEDVNFLEKFPKGLCFLEKIPDRVNYAEDSSNKWKTTEMINDFDQRTCEANPVGENSSFTFTACVKSVPLHHFKLAYVASHMAVKEVFEIHFQ